MVRLDLSELKGHGRFRRVVGLAQIGGFYLYKHGAGKRKVVAAFGQEDHIGGHPLQAGIFLFGDVIFVPVFKGAGDRYSVDSHSAALQRGFRQGLPQGDRSRYGHFDPQRDGIKFFGVPLPFQERIALVVLQVGGPDILEVPGRQIQPADQCFHFFEVQGIPQLFSLGAVDALKIRGIHQTPVFHLVFKVEVGHKLGFFIFIAVLTLVVAADLVGDLEP